MGHATAPVSAEEEIGTLRARVAQLEQELEQQRRNQDMLVLLAEASRLMANSLDYEITLARVAKMAVPGIADWCAVDILEEDGELRRLAVEHVDPARVALAYELQRRTPFDPDAPTGVAAVLRSGQSDFIPLISEDMIRGSVADPELRDILLSLGLRSSMVVPLQARGRTLGAITMIAAESGRLYTQADLHLAEDLARRAAIAIDNARLYRELRQFHTTLDQIRDSVYMFDPETLAFFYANQGATSQSGYDDEELLDHTPLDLLPDYSAAELNRLLDTLRSGETTLLSFETRLRRKDGNTVPVDIVLQYVDPEDADGRFVAVVREISERKQAEANLRASERRHRELAEAMPLLVWNADSTGKGIYYNRRWYEYTGATADEAARGWLSYIHPDDLAACQERWQHSLATGEPFELEYRFRHYTGDYRWQLARAVLVEEDGHPAYWVGTNTDIDEQKRGAVALQERSEELARVADLLESRNRELDQFAYITSHDLKAPLRGIGNLAQWIEEDLGEQAPAEVRSHLELLKGRVGRMEALIDGILQYSRIGRVAGRLERVDTAAMVADVVDLLAPPPHVAVTVAPDMPALLTERVALQQVFANLIGNAIKHNPGRPLEITVSARIDGPHIEFRVSDNGRGIAPQYHERIFGIFQTLESRDTIEGSGLGLALVRKIVSHQRGTVRVASAEGQGATFTFTWPYHAAAVQA